MANIIAALRAIEAGGVCTYRDIEAATGIDVNKMRWTINDLKRSGEVEQTEDPLTNEVAWRLTPLGRLRLAERLAAPDGKASRRVAAEKAKPAASATSRSTAKSSRKPAATAPRTRSSIVSTPAGGGADITGSQASESLVEGSGHADSSAEGLAIGEAAPQGETLAAPAGVVAAEAEAIYAAINALGEFYLVIGGKTTLVSPEDTRRLGEFMAATQTVWSAA